MKAEKAADKRVPFSRSAKARPRTRKKPLDPDQKALLAAFGRVLTRLQKRSKLTDEELAEKAEISVKRLQTIAAGERAAYMEDLFCLANALGIKASDFLRRVYRVKNAGKKHPKE